MPDILHKSHSLEKTSEGISGSLTFWENSPISPVEVGDTFYPIPNGTPLTAEKVSIKDNVLGTFNGKLLRQWDNFEGRTGYLKSLEVESGNKPFGNIHIGDSTDKLRRELGDPVNESGSLWEYEIYLYGYHEGYVEELVDACIFRFGIEDGRISRMYYYNHENGEDGETKW